MNDNVLQTSLKNSIYKFFPPTGEVNFYSPKRDTKKKYKGELVIYNKNTQQFDYY